MRFGVSRLYLPEPTGSSDDPRTTPHWPVGCTSSSGLWLWHTPILGQQCPALSCWSVCRFICVWPIALYPSAWGDGWHLLYCTSCVFPKATVPHVGLGTAESPRHESLSASSSQPWGGMAPAVHESSQFSVPGMSKPTINKTSLSLD